MRCARLVGAGKYTGLALGQHAAKRIFHTSTGLLLTERRWFAIAATVEKGVHAAREQFSGLFRDQERIRRKRIDAIVAEPLIGDGTKHDAGLAEKSTVRREIETGNHGRTTKQNGSDISIGAIS